MSRKVLAIIEIFSKVSKKKEGRDESHNTFTDSMLKKVHRGTAKMGPTSKIGR